MTRSELVKRLAREKPGLSASDCDRIVAAIFDSISSQLAAGGRVQLRGFGVFTIKTRDAQMGVNPRAGTKIYLPKRRVPAFRAASDLIARINNWPSKPDNKRSTRT